MDIAPYIKKRKIKDKKIKIKSKGEKEKKRQGERVIARGEREIFFFLFFASL